MSARILPWPERLSTLCARRRQAQARREAIRGMVRALLKGLTPIEQAVVIREAIDTYDHGASVWRAVRRGDTLARYARAHPGALEAWWGE